MNNNFHPISKAEENQCIHLAMQRAKEQLLDGTASSQVIVHFLKLGSSKEKIEKDILEHQRDLISAKTDEIRSTKQPGDLYGEAQEALTGYMGAFRKEEYYDDSVHSRSCFLWEAGVLVLRPEITFRRLH